MDVQDLREFAKTMNLPDLATYLMRSKREVREKMQELGYRVPGRQPGVRSRRGHKP